MNVYLCVIGIFSVIYSLEECNNSADDNKKIQECLKESGVAEESLETLMMADPPKTNCSGTCFLKKLEIIVDGKVDADKIIERVSKQESKEVSDSLKAIFIECANKANEEKDECEIPKILILCIQEKKRQRFGH